MRYFTTILLFFTLCVLNAQDTFEEEKLNNLLGKQINDYRTSKGLPPLDRYEVLDAAAFDQAEYLMDKNLVEHLQDNTKKRTAVDRVKYYGGLYYDVGENAAKVRIGGREEVYPSGNRVVINSAEQAVSAAIQSWMEDNASSLNIEDPYFNHFGSAVVKTDKNLDIVVVFAGLPFQLPQSSNAKINQLKVDPPSREKCKDLWDNFNTAPQLFSDAIVTEGNEVFFQFHSLETVEDVLANSGDAITVDVICDNQFACGSANRLYPGAVNDGYVLPLSKKGKLVAFNSLKEEGKVKLKLGELPDFYQPEHCELNGIIIKNGAKCATIPYNKFETIDLRRLEIPYLLSGDTIDNQQLVWKDTLNLSYTLKSKDGVQNAENVFSQLNKVLQSLNYQLESLSITQTFSPIAKASESNFMSNLKQKIEGNFPEITVKESQQSMWEEYFTFQKNSIYEMETKSKDTSEIVSYLKETSKTDTALNTFLSGLNTVKFHITGEAELNVDQPLEKKLEILSHLINNNNIKQALALQRNIILVDQAYAEIQDYKIAQVAENIPLISNKIVAAVRNGEKVFMGNPIHRAFLELTLVAKKYPVVNYNKSLSELKRWSKNPDKQSGLADWDEDFKKLRNKPKIPRTAYAKTMVNYALLAANYYYDKGKFDERDKVFELLMKWYSAASFSDIEILRIAKYFTYQDQFNHALKLLLPIVKADEPKKELLFYFLQIGIYDNIVIDQNGYNELLAKASELYPEAYCDFFGKKQRGIQALKNKEIKTLYCSNCK